jgi:uncharacterized protein YggE
MKRNKLALFVLLAVLAMIVAACSPAETQGQGADATVPGSITVIGQGEAFGEPDQAHVLVGVETFAPTAEEATNQNEATLEGVLSALQGVGIAPEDIQTSNYSLWAEQIYGERGPEGIAGYRVSNQVNVTIRDVNQVGTVLAAVTEAGANSIYGVYFSVADPAALEEQARAEAMADARARAGVLAELGSVELGSVRVISEVVGQPIAFDGRGGGGGFAVSESAVTQPGISPGQLSYHVQIEVTFNIQ